MGQPGQRNVEGVIYSCEGHPGRRGAEEGEERGAWLGYREPQISGRRPGKEVQLFGKTAESSFLSGHTMEGSIRLSHSPWNVATIATGPNNSQHVSPPL